MPGNTDTIEIGGPNSANATADEVHELEQNLNPDAAREHEDAEEHDDEGEGDERTTKNDAELGDAKSEEEREAIRERRRKERQDRKAKSRERLDTATRLAESLAAQNRELNERLARLENNDAALKLHQLDEAINTSAADFNRFKQAHAAAISKQDGATAAQAMDGMLQARDTHTKLTGLKESVVSAARQPTGLSDSARKLAGDFARKHSWYGGPKATDQDSYLLTALDAKVQADGFNSSTPEYWAELESRAKAVLPHRFTAKPGNSRENTANSRQNGYTEANGRETPRSPVGGTAERGVSGEEGGFRLSAERVKAMKESGDWEDPAKRQKMIERFKAYDKTNRTQ